MILSVFPGCYFFIRNSSNRWHTAGQCITINLRLSLQCTTTGMKLTSGFSSCVDTYNQCSCCNLDGF
ncbi:unnamed protein product [Ilex paraguariensis]|uniref:Uncharacterized protein n=1 Tax=Ilex paraguariensis TaxID=185542 RepID=A0ABC8UKC7_9AQUA